MACVSVCFIFSPFFSFTFKRKNGESFLSLQLFWSISFVLFGKWIYLKIILIPITLNRLLFFFWYCELGNKFRQLVCLSIEIIGQAYKDYLAHFNYLVLKIHSKRMIKQIVQSIYISTRRLQPAAHLTDSFIGVHISFYSFPSFKNSPINDQFKNIYEYAHAPTCARTRIITNVT